MAANPSFVSGPRTATVSIANADSTNFKTLFTPGSDGARVDMVSISNSDGSNAYVVQVAVQVGSTDFVLGEVTVPAGSGTNGSAKSVNMLNSTDIPALASTLNVLFLESGAVLRVKSKTAVNGANTLHFVATGGDY